MKIVTQIATLVVLALSMPTTGFAQACHSSGLERDIFVNWVKLTVSTDSTNSFYNARRTQLQLPFMDSSLVVLKTDSVSCANAFTALRALTYPSTVIQTPMVLKVGNKYIASDSHSRAGEWRLATVFDSTWTKVSGFTF